MSYQRSANHLIFISRGLLSKLQHFVLCSGEKERGACSCVVMESSINALSSGQRVDSVSDLPPESMFICSEYLWKDPEDPRDQERATRDRELGVGERLSLFLFADFVLFLFSFFSSFRILYTCFFFNLAAPHSMWNPSSLTWD